MFNKGAQQVFDTFKANYDGLPIVLGFQLARNQGEIFMSDAGHTLGVWFRMLE